MPTNTVSSLGDILLNAMGRREMEKRYEQESMDELRRLLSGAGRGAGTAANPGVPAARPAGLVVDPSGGVQDGRGWFSAGPPRWVNDSENWFVADAPARGSARAPVADGSAGGAAPSGGGALPPVGATAAAAPGGGGGPSATGAAGGGLGSADLHQYILLAKSAGIDPTVAMKLLDAQMARAQRQQALDALPDPYSRANAAFGKAVALPYGMSAHGTVNQATGESTPSAYATAAAAAQTAAAGANAALADQRSAMTPAMVAAENALAGSRAASAEAARSLAQQRSMDPAANPLNAAKVRTEEARAAKLGADADVSRARAATEGARQGLYGEQAKVQQDLADQARARAEEARARAAASRDLAAARVGTEDARQGVLFEQADAVALKAEADAERAQAAADAARSQAANRTQVAGAQTRLLDARTATEGQRGQAITDQAQSRAAVDAARTDLLGAQTAGAYAGADASTARAEQTRALTAPQVAATEALTGQRQAAESKQLRVRLADGRLGEVRPGADGKLTVVPIYDADGQPARGAQATQAREQARGQTPQQYMADRYKVRALQYARDPAKAADLARQDTEAVFGPGALEAAAPAPAPVAGGARPEIAAPPQAAAEAADPMATAVQEALANLDRYAAEAIRAAPHKANLIRLEADKRRRAILQLQQPGGAQ